jgi:hypothetical protein
MTRVPAALEAAIKDDLRPVRPLPPPVRRAAWAAPLALLTLVAATLVFGLRGDAPRLGWALTWGSSILQTLLGLAVIAIALREAVPGRAMRPAALLLITVVALGFSAALTLRTWSISPTGLGRFSPLVVGQICFTGTVVSALPLLAVTAVLASRAFIVRPWSAGMLYGLGAGLGADAGWRLFCHFSDPAHVLPTHTAAVVATAAVGVGVAVARDRSAKALRHT